VKRGKRLRPERRVGHVRTPNRNGTCSAQTLDARIVVLGDRFREHPHPQRRRRTRNADALFDRERHTVQQADGSARRARPIGSICRRSGFAIHPPDDRVQRWVDFVHAPEVRLDDLAARHLPGTHQSSQLNCPETPQFVHVTAS
jgi:hypothetical protein